MNRRVASVALALPLAMTLAVAGCGGSGGDGDRVASANGDKGASPTSSAGEKLSDEEAQRKFTQCMRDNGVDVPDPAAGEKGPVAATAKPPDPAKMEKAMEKCRGFLPHGGEAPKPDAAQIERMRKMSKCIRDNGVPDFPDPDANGELAFSGDTPAKGDKMRAAMEKCAPASSGGGGVKK
jgi:hypothetical protein